MKQVTPVGGSQASLRVANATAITDALASGGPQLQADLARSTGLSKATVSNIVAEQVSSGTYRVEKVLRDGRWGTLISLAPEDWVVIGLDIGRSHLRICGWDTAHKTFGEHEIDLELGHTPPQTLAVARRLVDELLAEAGLDRSRLRRIGIAIPSSIDPEGRAVEQAVLREWSGINIAKESARALGADVVVDNDSNLGAYAHATAGGNETLIYIKMASGIGAGILTGGTLFHSTSGVVGELGHMPVVEGGQACYCGSRGCLETLSSTRAVVSAYSHVRGINADVDDVLAAVAKGDPAATRIISEAGDALGRVLTVVCNLISPDRIVIGGRLAQAGAPLIDAVVSAVRFRVLSASVAATRFEASPLGLRAEVLGACLAAINPPAGAAGASSLRSEDERDTNVTSL